MQSNLAQFEAVHRELTVTSPPSSAYARWFALEQTVSASYLQFNSVRAENNATVPNLISEFISSVQVIVLTPLENCTMSNDYVYFTVTNHDVLHDVLQTCLQLRFQDLTAFYSTVSYLVSCLGSVAAIVLVDSPEPSPSSAFAEEYFCC